MKNKRTATHGCAVPGASKTPEYRVWSSMKTRCSNPKQRGWEYYGKRGIKVCERWMNFCNFIADMGPRPSPAHSIDRIDNNGDYSPENCRWGTKREQSLNTRKTRVVEVNGEKMSLREYTKRFEVPVSRAVRCLERGEPLFPPPPKPTKPRRQYLHPVSGKPISRERDRQLKWEARGLCPRCPTHPPIYRGNHCKSCYAKACGGRLPKRQDGGASRLIPLLKKSIATHEGWIAKYRARLSANVAKHRSWISRYRAEIKALKNSPKVTSPEPRS